MHCPCSKMGQLKQISQGQPPALGIEYLQGQRLYISVLCGHLLESVQYDQGAQS